MADDSLSILKSAHKAMLETGFMGDGTARRYRDEFYAEVGRHVPTLMDELSDLRALVSRARELAKRIGEAEKRTATLHEQQMQLLKNDGGEGGLWFDAFAKLSLEKAEPESDAYNARQELLAMFTPEPTKPPEGGKENNAHI